MIDPSKTTRLKALSRRFTTAIVPAVGAVALFASAQSAHALTKWQKDFVAQLAATDIEDIAELAGTTMATPLPNGKLQAYSRAKIYVRLAVLNINSRTAPTNPAPGDAIKFGFLNKQDEIGETVAYVIGKIALDLRLQKVKKTPTLGVQVRGIIKEAIKNAGTGITEQFITDVVGSASRTVLNAPNQGPNLTAIQTYLLKFANKTSILGTRANTQNPLYAVAVQKGISEGFNPGVQNKYEDGNPGPTLDNPPKGGASLITIADPETDFRPA
jgi:hypothetical protein